MKESIRAPDAEDRERIGLESARITFVLNAKNFLTKQGLPN